MNKKPILQEFPAYLKLLTFAIIIFLSLIFIMMLGLIIAYPFWGTDILEKMTNIETFVNSDVIAFAKYFQIVSQFGIFIIPPILFAFLDGRNIGAYLKINFRPAIKTMILASCLIFAAVPLINFLAEINRQMKFPAFMSDIEQWMRTSEAKATQLTDAFLNVSTAGGFFINIFMIAVIPAIGEEFLFRGILQPLFHKWFRNVHFAVIFSAFIFSFIHIQFYGFLPRLFMGILLGYVFVLSGSLWIPILVHFVNNFTAVLISFVTNNNIKNTFETIGTGKSAILPVLLSISLTGIFIYLIYHNKRIRK